MGIQPHIGEDSLCIIRQFPYTGDFETAPAGREAVTSDIRRGYSWMVVDSTGVDGNYSAGVFHTLSDNCDDQMFSPAIVTPGDYKVNWKVRAMNASVSDSYTFTVDTETFNETVGSTTWQTS